MLSKQSPPIVLVDWLLKQWNDKVGQSIDITVRDGKLKFPLNQNVLRDVTSRWSMRITARSSDY